MAKKEEDNAAQPIIIKKVKKGGHGGHHGGAWKVAYADFVTAMMAFFLLLWLLQATTEEQKLGIADYFAPSSVSSSTSGSGGLMGGRTFTKKGANPSDQSPIGVLIKLPTNPADAETQDNPVTNETDTVARDSAGDMAARDMETLLAQQEEAQFAAAEQALQKAIEGVPDLRSLTNNLVIDRTEDGMRIQIVDEAGKSMFPSGSAEMFDHTQKLLGLVVDAIRGLPQQIAIKGHTDSTPYANTHGYSNWELSSDRANSSRRALIQAGLPPERISSVVGLADTDHLDKDTPFSPRNRRISIILLRKSAPRALASAPAPRPAPADGAPPGDIAN
ncbi:MAG: flagellar motor protein MotB [Kiloniellaceae bacterium]